MASERSRQEAFFEPFTTRGSDVAARMARMDWSGTSLGPFELWPGDLLACIRDLLSTSTPAFLVWGKKSTLLYNDAYARSLGQNDAGALGKEVAPSLPPEWNPADRKTWSELSRSQRFLNSLIENNPNMVFVKDARELRFVEFNLAGEQLLGLRRSEMLGKNDYDFFPKEQADFFTEKDRAVLRGRTVVDIPEERIQTKAGDTRILHTKKIPVFDQDGNAEFLLGVSEDITDKIQAERDRIRLLREQFSLEERERAAKRTNFLAEASTALARSLDYQETLRELTRIANTRLSDWCVVVLAEETGGENKLRIAAIGGKPDQSTLLNELRTHILTPGSPGETGISAVIETGRSGYVFDITDEMLPRLASGARHLEILRKLGIRSSMTVPISSHRKTHGAISYVVGGDRALYDREDLEVAEELGRRAGIALENALLYQEAQKAIRARDDFLSIASHELKTPLTSLKLHLQMTRRTVNPAEGKTPSPEKLLRVLDDSTLQVNRLSALIEDLLDVSRISTGRLQFDFERTDLTALVRESAERCRPLLESAGSHLISSIEEGVFLVADHRRIEQVLFNLLSNAAKYGAGRPVELTLQSISNGFARISVRDHGMGIPSEKLKTIFERFERAVPFMNITGMGLGLYITREIIESHHGTIEVESALDQGSVFTVILPLDFHPSSPSPESERRPPA